MGLKRIAHRGFSSMAPENTIPAFAMATEGEFYGIECDIWRSACGTYVVSHDNSIERMCGIKKKITDITYDEIKSYPVISGEHIDDHPIQHIPSFEEYLSIVARSDYMRAVVELKMDYTAVELGEIVSLVCEYDLYERTFFISLYPTVLIRLRDLSGFPSERLQYVYGAGVISRFIPVRDKLISWLIKERIGLDSRYTLISKEAVDIMHAKGLCVNVWTVNDRKDYDRMKCEIGVDMVTSNNFYS